MSDYFAAFPNKVQALVAEAESWDGTPFRQQSAVKGTRGGVDCTWFVGQCFLAIGAITEALAMPPYALNHAEHSEDSILREWFERPEVRRRVRRVDEEESWLDGDLCFPEVGRTEHHLALRVGDDLYHIARTSGWCRSRVSQVKLHKSRYRLIT